VEIGEAGGQQHLYMNYRKMGNLFQVCWMDFGVSGAEHAGPTSSELVGFILDSLFCRSE